MTGRQPLRHNARCKDGGTGEPRRRQEQGRGTVRDEAGAASSGYGVDLSISAHWRPSISLPSSMPSKRGPCISPAQWCLRPPELDTAGEGALHLPGATELEAARAQHRRRRGPASPPRHNGARGRASLTPPATGAQLLPHLRCRREEEGGRDHVPGRSARGKRERERER